MSCCIQSLAFIASVYRVAELKERMERLQGTYKLHDAQWTGKEKSYKKTIQHLEAKVGF